MKILMIYPKFPETFWNAARSARVFLHRRAEVPPLGLLTIASYLPSDFEVRLVDRNVSEDTDAEWEWADVVFLSVMLAQRDDYELCVRKARARQKPLAVGGPLTHAIPEEVLAQADWVCFGEAESIMDRFVADLRADRRGRQYDGGNTTDMESVKLPRFELIPDLNIYAVMAIQFSRGCPFRCEFCDIIEIYGRVPRTKTAAQMLAELGALEELGFRGHVFVVDDNFIGNKKRAMVMLKEVAAWNGEKGHPFWFITEASINLADDEALLEAMSRAGFSRVFIGIETPDPGLLKATLKYQNLSGDPLEKLRTIRAHGIHIIGGFIVGFDGETRDVFEVQRSFIDASGIGVAMVGMLQAIPHTQLSRRLSREGRLLQQASLKVNLTREGINFIPKGEITKREYLERYRWLLMEVYAPEAFFQRILRALLVLRPLPFRAVSLWRAHIPVFLRLSYQLGVRNRRARRYFWKALYEVLRKNPGAIEAFAHDSYYYYHLSRHTDFTERELSLYLSSPPPDDVLDAVVREDPAADSVSFDRNTRQVV
jgi:radical SAM superfamily enzyme YgiQ (UPF0313 family)